MKSKDIFTLMINPFTRIAGLQAFGLGIVFITLMGVIGSYSNVIFDGTIDLHISNQMSLVRSFSYLGIDIFCLVITMWISSLLVSKNFRFVDILGTMTLSKAPLLIFVVAALFVTTPNMQEIAIHPMEILHYKSFLAISILLLPLLVWNFTLMVNALKVSCDLKGTKLAITFILSILVSEIGSKILISVLL